ncbi:Thymidylate kinase [Olavius algarvensis spirochete endosymbiont]|nr:MAG: Thymidylate kinase (EC 2.7.4.9) [Olavius algarvensis spirochete endosymbiont]VDA99833.1 Thymidylate kinase [Olavius algarvensis spirochete endosymbiont]
MGPEYDEPQKEIDFAFRESTLRARKNAGALKIENYTESNFEGWMSKTRNIWKGLVAIEGIDGSGTTTLLSSLEKSLKGKNIRFGAEPTNGNIGEVIRDALSGRKAVTPKTLALLFAADRREHIYGGGGIQEGLDSGLIYITDRYLFSSLAYQTLSVDWHWVDQLNSEYPLPSHMVYLRIPVEHALERISARDEKDIFETAELQYKVAEGYMRSIEKYRDSGIKILEIDSRGNLEETCAAVLNFIGELF